MEPVSLTLERDETNIFIFSSNLRGFYLWGTDVERVIGSIIPLIQHLFWKNRNMCVAPLAAFDPEQLLTEGKTTVAIQSVSILRAPDILIEGEFWTNEAGVYFFVPSSDGMIHSKVLEKITSEMCTS